MDETTEGVVVLVLVLGGVVVDVGEGVDVFKSERGQDDDDEVVDEKVVKVFSLSNGGKEVVDEEDEIVVGSVNVKGEGGRWDCSWEDVVAPIDEAEVDVVEPHEFLLPFLFFWACNFKPPDLLAALIAAWLLGIWLWVVLLLLEVEVVEEW